MNQERPLQIDQPTRHAIDELQGLIRARYPDAVFQVAHGEDPEGTYLKATVDVEDIDQVVDVFIDRLLEMQIDEGLPVYVIPLEPLERVIERMRSPAALPRRYRAVEGPVLNP